MIYIVIDNETFPASVAGVFRSYEDADKYILQFPEDGEGLSLVTWDIIKNAPVQDD